MPTAATMVRGNADAPQQSADAAVVRHSFVRAARERIIGSFDTHTEQIGASAIQVGPIDIPPSGFLRSIDLVVTTTGGSGGSAAGTQDAPWNALADISLQDVNGRPLVGPFSGYDLYLINKWGGYAAGEQDPANLASFTALNATTGGFAFRLRIPVEITARDALGALPNLTSAATYKLYYTVSAAGTIYDVEPVTTLPSVTVRCYANLWSQPAAQGPDRVMNDTTPPALGTTQFWSKQNITVSAGEQQIQLTRMGNHIRNWIFVYRDSGAARDTTDFPDEHRIEWDNKILTADTKILAADRAEQFYGPGMTLDEGVHVIPFTHDADGKPGNENRNLWIPTVSGTFIQVIGDFNDSGILTVLTNDIAVRGKVQLSSGNPGN